MLKHMQTGVKLHRCFICIQLCFKVWCKSDYSATAGAFLQHPRNPPLLFLLFFILYHLRLLLEQMDFLRDLMCFCCSRIFDSRWDWMAMPRHSRSTEAPYTSHVMPCLSHATSCGVTFSSLSSSSLFCSLAPLLSPFSSSLSSQMLSALMLWFCPRAGLCWKLYVRRQAGRELALSVTTEGRTDWLRSSMSILQIC